jgi:hypothetical protein
MSGKYLTDYLFSELKQKLGGQNFKDDGDM